VPRVKPIDHEDRLSIVEHLDELRSRLVVSAFVFAIAFGLCFWQNNVLLDIANDPIGQGRQPITLSPAEAFTTTMTVSAYFAILLAGPVLLYQLYSFILPAFTPKETRVAKPLLLLVPVLFITGVVFGYFVVIPAALDFLLDFNSDQFQNEIRARDYYSFVSMTLLAMGGLFQIPVGILAATKLGITNAKKLRKNRRYAILLIAVVAAALPGVDPVTMLIEMVPLLVLFELSILLAAAFGRPSAEAEGETDVPDSPGVAPAEGS
jgi:sec-independent protein translocase protein TatC